MGNTDTPGSSPRLRGTRRPAPAEYRRGGFIPAPAGNTPARSMSITFASVHPRACGEHPTRGQDNRPSPVHPRACGEHHTRQPGYGGIGGSSPRLRGTPYATARLWRHWRFIPAPAGNTIRDSQAMAALAVHPRACGEHLIAEGEKDVDTGSSPRLRGTPGRSMARHHSIRFIPAPAGNTPTRPASDQRGPVHPRACGEHPVRIPSSRAIAGSSPRLRGTRLPVRGRVDAPRFIPAPAGNTRSPRRVTPRGSVHPRACGEHAILARSA